MVEFVEPESGCEYFFSGKPGIDWAERNRQIWHEAYRLLRGEDS